MGTTITRADCATQFDSNNGFLRPEGFLCGDCYRERYKDRAYVAEGAGAPGHRLRRVIVRTPSSPASTPARQRQLRIDRRAT